jgi:Tol biopolymer transport system component/DNA-binding winged helix-turn-helix (wHTH) protein
VEKASPKAQLLRFATFEVDLRAGELRKSGLKLKFSGQPFQVLAILLERPGEVVTREDLQQRLWPDTFVDVDHNLNTAINKIREVLGDAAENPRFVETLPRRGYRFIAPLDNAGNGAKTTTIASAETAAPRRVLGGSLLFGVVLLLAAIGFLIYRGRQVPASPKPRELTRITFDDGLQVGATWSPDGSFVAYGSDRGGKLDIWVQQLTGGDPVQVTKGPGHNWQPDWSPNGKLIAYRSEEGDGGLYIMPALGGSGLERKIASFGYYPRWSPDSSQILFQTEPFASLNRFYVVRLDASPPREVLSEITAHQSGISAGWHPDGKRISAWLESDLGPRFWTGPTDGGPAVLTEATAEVLSQFGDPTAGSAYAEAIGGDFKFAWTPSGSAVYFECTFQGARNIWRMTIDPQTLRDIALERLTAGPGPDVEPSLSPNGKKLAFTSETRRVSVWMFPFDGGRGRVTGSGRAVTSPGVYAWRHNLSRDGNKFVFEGMRAGKWILWVKSISDGREIPVVADDSYFRSEAQWSPDNTRLAYMRAPIGSKSQVVVWSDKTRSEEPITTLRDGGISVSDWSVDGKSLLVSQTNSETHQAEIWLVPLDGRPQAEAVARKIAFSPTYSLFKSHFSPDGRWIVFEAARRHPTGWESTIYAIAAAGGPWIRITNGKQWDDKPVWSRDGRSIYFISRRHGFFNVMGIRFDPNKGRPVGDTFPVTGFDSPKLMIPSFIQNTELSLTQDRLTVTVAQTSGSIWMLDNVDR